MIFIKKLQNPLYLFRYLEQNMAKERGSLKIEEESNSTSGKNYLLVIGINDYQHFSVLNNAVRDAETIRDLLIGNYQFQAEHTTSLFNEEATRENILEALYEYEDIITPNDNFLLYFAGHGTMNAKETQGYWIPAEADRKRAQYIANTIIRDILKDIEAHHTYLIVDSCFSGSMILRDAKKEENLVESLPSRRVLTSGRKQVVADGPRGGHSPFAECIIQYLKRNSSENISALDLEYHVQKNTPRNADQSPEASFIYGLGDQSGQFVFYPQNIKKEVKWADLKGNLKACKKYIKNNPKGQFIEEVFWEIANLTDQASDFRIYASKFRRGKFISEALVKITSVEEKQAFENAKKRGWTGLMQFINQYPDSQYADEAETEIDKIEEEEKKARKLKSQNIVNEKIKQIILSLKENSVKEKIESPKAKPYLKGPIEMVLVESGSFMMGSNESENEKPIHKVFLDSFQIGKYPVTQNQWEDIIGNNPSKFRNCQSCPVESVSWDDVQKFLEVLNYRYPRMNYRLPTESEWEYAARGGGKSKSFIYAGSNKADKVGWFMKNSGRKTQTVGQKLPNELGIHDMSGNVWEWCSDWYNNNYSKAFQANNRNQPTSSSRKVIRGGSWYSYPRNLHVPYRNSYPPDFRGSVIGFRLARSL